MKLFFIPVLCASAALAQTITCSTGTYPKCTKPTVYTVNEGATATQISDLGYANAERGDEIRFVSGGTWTMAGNGLYFPRTVGTGSGYLTVTVTEQAKLPPDGTRITPAYIPLMATLQNTGSNYTMVIGGDHIKIRGIRFRPNPDQVPAINPITMSAPTPLMIGRVSNVDLSGGLVNRLNMVYPPIWEARLTASAAAGQNTITVDTTARLAPGMRVGFGNSGAYMSTDTQVIQEITGPTTFTTVNPLGAAHPALDYVRVVLEDVSLQPDDIIVQHCIFRDSTHLVPISRHIGAHSRQTLIRDNFFEDAFSRAADSQLISSRVGTGPLVIENNFMSGATENFMTGGDKPSINVHLESSLQRFNWFGKAPERDRIGPWRWINDPNRQGTGIVFAGKMVFPTADTNVSNKNWFIAKNTGYVGTSEPAFGSVAQGQTIQDGGVTWLKMGGNGYQKLIKNNWELKTGANITLQYNVLENYAPMNPWNTGQNKIINIKSLPEGCYSWNSTTPINEGKTSWPDCWQAKLDNINILNNVMITQAGGFLVVPSQFAKALPTGPITISGNLVVATEDPYDASISGNLIQTYAFFSLSNGSDPMNAAAGCTSGCGYLRSLDMGSFTIANNTFVDRNAASRYSSFFNMDAPACISGSVGLCGNNSVRANIMTSGWLGHPAGGAAGKAWTAGNTTDGGAQLAKFPCSGTSNCTSEQWDRNVIIGAPNTTSNWPSGTVLTNCPTAAACTPNYNYADAATGSVPLFRNVLAGKFAVTERHSWAKRKAAGGNDIGADTSQLPLIQGLTVTPTHQSVLFRWSVTQPIAHVPCVVEVHTSPDFDGDYRTASNTVVKGMYVGEMSQVATFHGQEADDNDRNTRSGLDRMLMVGHMVPLSPGTTYNYRLHCGGPIAQGTFTTTAPANGNVTQTISRLITDGSVRSMEVEYGTQYSRTADSMDGSSTVAAACESQQTCSVSFSVPKGSILYYRWRERNGAGMVVHSGNVSTVVAQ